MPIGIIINALSIVIGGILGAFVGHKLSPKFKEDITLVFGVCSMGMGISTIGLMENMPAVIFSVVIGTGIGLAIHLGERINAGAGVMQRVIGKFIKNSNSELSEDEFMNTLVTIIVLFCASGTGIYGSIVSGMSGDHSVLISKSILDLFTAAIFACSLGMVVCMIAIPQVIIFLILFFAATAIFPLTTPGMINDFKAYFKRHNQTIYENPSPGNKKGGISTLEDKSLGCTQKSGSAPVKGVLSYGERVSVPGLNLLSAPGNDLVAATALAASGAHIVLFTTGRGTPFASPVPTVKIASNSALAGKKKNWIDFNAGVLVEDSELEETGQKLFDYVLEVASGKKVCSEEAGFHDMAIFKQGVTL